MRPQASSPIKHQGAETPVGKQSQHRRKTPRIGPLLIAITVICTVIPIYYPSLRYAPKILSDSSSSFSRDDDPIRHENKVSESVTSKSGQPDKEVNSLVKSIEEVQEHVRLMKKNSNRPPTEPDSHRQQLKAATPQTPDKKTEKPGKVSPGQHSHQSVQQASNIKNCDIFTGEWVPNPEGPYYTNETCDQIQEHQNCMKYGRPDTGFMKWRWKPDDCDLPIFDPHLFLELLRGKALAFVGDSVARNHMQSLLCLLGRVAYPVDLSDSKWNSNRRYFYPDYNFNISIFWSPYMIRTEKIDTDDSRPFNLFLDEYDESWRTPLKNYDYLIISAGQWFFRPTMFYVNRHLVGCLYCQETNIKHMSTYFSYRRAFRTAFKAINTLDGFKGITFLRTYVPSHFEGGPWDKGGDCVRTRPFKRNETVLDDYNLEMYTIQLQELKIAKKGGRSRGLKFRLFDTTKAMLLRPDGHPSKYGHWPQENVTLFNDCVHWCLPGPVDAWNDFLQELVKKEESR